MPRKSARKTARRSPRKTATRRKNTRRTRSKKTEWLGMSPLQWGVLGLSFLCLLTSIYFTFFMDGERSGRSANREPKSITEKARQLAEEHPDAEVFNLNDPEKKKSY